MIPAKSDKLTNTRQSNYLYLSSFTLIELVIVILIISIISVVAIANFDPASSIKIYLAAKKIQSDIRYTQSLATSIQKRTRITFNSGADSYTVEIENTPGSWVTAKNRLGNDDFTVQLNTGTYSGIDITSVSFNGNGVIFDKWGNPYDLSGGVLSDLGGVGLNGTLNVKVKKATGRVTIQ